jgi:hypothetical protein
MDIGFDDREVLDRLGRKVLDRPMFTGHYNRRTMMGAIRLKGGPVAILFGPVSGPQEVRDHLMGFERYRRGERIDGRPR